MARPRYLAPPLRWHVRRAPRSGLAPRQALLDLGVDAVIRRADWIDTSGAQTTLLLGQRGGFPQVIVRRQ